MKNLITLIFTLVSIAAFGQPVNDDCAGTVNLGTAPVCTETIYSNTGATASDIGSNNTPDCFLEEPSRDVWFSFFADAELTSFNVKIEASSENGNPIQNIQAGLYRGFCPDNVFAINTCAAGQVGEGSLEFQISDLTPNDLYFIRVDNFGGAAAAGDFTICVVAQDQEFNISDGSTSECNGVLYDSGGPNGDYAANEESVFTICPGVVNQCIEFNLEYYNIEGSLSGKAGDVINFYNGEDTNAPLITTLSGADGIFPSGNSGVCFTVYAENCLTIEMISDGNTEFEGFKASWKCSNRSCEIPEPIAIDTNPIVEKIVESLSSSLVDITVTNIDCSEGAYGIFSAGESTGLGIDGGILLTSGNANYAIGPNNTDGLLAFSNGKNGDDDLDALSELLGGNTLSNDACVIEVEAFVNSSELNFQFLFGSEEYPEFAEGDFNDIFALFIEGPGIEGVPELGGKKNLAVLPGTNTPIQIKSVNSAANYEYYRNNQGGSSTQYDGLVVDRLGVQKSLTATTRVTPCNTYNLKFAIADRGDFIFDSGVFISELTNSVPEINLVSSYGFNYLLEKCTDGLEQIVIQLSDPQEMDLKFVPVLGGTATEGVDYMADLPDTIIIEAGQTLVTFPITVISDDIDEGTETIEILFQNDFGCGVVDITSVIIEIREAVEIIAGGGQDTIYICSGLDFVLTAEGATNYTWSPTENLGDPNVQNPTFVQPTQTTTFTVVGNIQPFDIPECTGSDMITVIPVNPEVNLVTEDDLRLCFGDSIGVTIEGNTDGVGVTWENPELGVQDPNSSFTFIKPTITSLEPIPYIINVELDGCTSSDTLFLQVDEFNFPEVLVQDSLICEGYQVQLTEDPGSEGTTYQWTPSDFLNNDTIASPIATASEDITYKLVATSFSGACADSVEINITVQDNEIEINSADTVFLCFPDSIEFSTIGTSQGVNVTWEPSDIITPATGPDVKVVPLVSGYAIASMDFNGCQDMDSVWIQIDSLPSMEFEVIQEKDMYCIGEVISIVSAGFDPLDFPNIEFSWESAPGIVSELDERNLAIIAADTATFTRITTNGACMDTIEHEIFVLDPIVAIIVSDTSALCPFDPVGLMIESEHQLEDIMWEPGMPDLTCDDCIDPFASVGQTTTVTASMDADGCPATASAEIRIKNVQLQINFSQNGVCPGTPVQLSLSGNGPISDISWSPANVLSCVDCPNPIATVDGSTTIEVSAIVDGCNASAQRTLEVDASERQTTITVSPNDTVPAGAAITLTVQNEVSFGSNTTFEWFINGQSQGLSGNTFTTNQADTVSTEYSVKIVDENGCFWAAQTSAIGVFPRFKLPNAFTPGGQDELNNVFRLIQTPAVDLDNWQVSKFAIYNRWGEKVFECEDRECAVETGWNGRLSSNNNLAPADVYIYTIQVEIDNGDTIDFRGDVTLLR